MNELKEKIEIRIEPYLKKLLEEQSKNCGMKLSQWIRWSLRKQVPASKLVSAQLKCEDIK